MTRATSIGVVCLDPQLFSNDPSDDKPAVDRGDGRVIGKDLPFDRQHTLVNEPIAVVILAVANLIARAERTFANDTRAIVGANVFARHALADAGPFSAGLAELGPTFIHRGVAVVIDAVTPLDIGFLRFDRVWLLTRSVDLPQRLGTGHLAAASDRKQPNQHHDRHRAK